MDCRMVIGTDLLDRLNAFDLGLEGGFLDDGALTFL